jgi:hypothetical protein
MNPGSFLEAIRNKTITMIPIIKYEKAKSPPFGKCWKSTNEIFKMKFVRKRTTKK